MIWLAVAVTCGILVEIFHRVPLAATVRGVLELSQKSARVISSGAISDHWKEKAVRGYSIAMVKRTALLFGMLVLFVAVVTVMIVAARTVDLDLYGFLLTWPGIVFSVGISILYRAVRFRNA